MSFFFRFDFLLSSIDLKLSLFKVIFNSIDTLWSARTCPRFKSGDTSPLSTFLRSHVLTF
jgi:hypothetical protein